ncbi:MAG: tetratricopeptide repeat protein [Deltaproteobacteria bacterium]|nr:tetratricopeptide repeat protein [Deltaproteobacteria bacterium]
MKNEDIISQTGKRPTSWSQLFCQVCGVTNQADREFCRRCHHKLLVVSGTLFEEDLDFDSMGEEGFSFDEHLLERISILEEVVKRSAESLRQLLGALRKQERNILVNNTGLAALRELLEEKRVLASDDWNELWQSRMDDHSLSLEKRERFLVRRERMSSLFEGRRQADFQDLLQDAETAFSAFDREGAHRALEAAYRLDGNNYELAHFLGETHFDDGDTDLALKYFSKVLELKSDHYEGLVYGGAIFYEKGDSERAEELLKRATVLYSDAFLPHFSLGAVFASQGELSQAVAYLERAVELDAVPQALYLLGSCLYEMGRASEAIRCLQDAVRADPASEEAHQLLGLAYLDRRWSRKALDALRQAQRLNPKKMHYRDLVLYMTSHADAPVPLPEGEARDLFAKAAVHLERDDLKQALVTYRQALDLDAENPMLLMAYALVCLQLNRGREIEALTRKVLELEPDEMLRTTAYATLIEALRSQGKYREGNLMGRRLLEEGSSDFTKTIAYYEMAYNLAETEEDLDEALDYARRSVELSPKELRQLPLAALGWVHYKRREFEQAIDFLSKASELAPSQTTLNHLGIALLASGQKEKARNILAEARSLSEGGQRFEEKMIECVKGTRRSISGARGNHKE